MTTALILAASVPLLHQIFTPLPLAEQAKHAPNLIFAAVLCCLATAYLALWRAAPDFRIFRNMGIFIALVAVDNLAPYFGIRGSAWTTRAITVLVLVEIAAEAMRIRNRRWTRYFWPIYIFAGIAGWFPAMARVQEWPIVFSEVALLFLVIQGFRQGKSTNRLIAWVFLGYFLVRMPLSSSFQHLTGIGGAIVLGGWVWPYPVFVVILLGSVILAVFVRDLIRDRREKMRMAAELAASRAVQHVLISEVTPATPGFEIESIYKPYGEVGGDFFQILPRSDGSVLIAIGDVSGKGMPAAMMVSLLVGAFNALAETTTSPAQLLAGLNRRILGRSHGGFTTCLILHASPDGTCTAANAGHIPPYLNGKELACENNLPLGLSAETHYCEFIFQASHDDKLTLLTDGVVEARSHSGELFGFERTAALASRTAESIAQAAQAFGQEDDITVLTVMRAAQMEVAIA
ncbi:MAG: PP2C family protein-serine/threonine phosphatase [Terracidiphilus sp.]